MREGEEGKAEVDGVSHYLKEQTHSLRLQASGLMKLQKPYCGVVNGKGRAKL